MARLLTNKDYLRTIQEDNLLQVITNDYQVLYGIEQSAQAEMIAYLKQRYDVSGIFTDTTTFDMNATYYGKNLVEYTEPLFDIQVDYDSGDRVVYEGKIYENTGSTSAGITPDYSPDWTFITLDRSFYFAKTTQPVWSLLTRYTTGQSVWYDNNIYIALADSVGKVPSNPDNFQYWSFVSTYSFTGILPTDTSYWSKGDNRNQDIVMFLLDITLYHAHSRINPRNIPELRMIRYDGNNSMQNGGAIAWLKRVAGGEINADLPTLIPEQGLAIRWGSEIKNYNSY